MQNNPLENIKFSTLDNLALARVEPFGLHLFEFIFYVFLGIFILLAFRSFLKSLGMIFLKPRKEHFLSSTDSTFVPGECAICGWQGQVPAFRKKCPKCGGTTFA
jgi:hypothetical protein